MNFLHLFFDSLPHPTVGVVWSEQKAVWCLVAIHVTTTVALLEQRGCTVWPLEVPSNSDCSVSVILGDLHPKLRQTHKERASCSTRHAPSMPAHHHLETTLEPLSTHTSVLGTETQPCRNPIPPQGSHHLPPYQYYEGTKSALIFTSTKKVILS